ncbi:MAG: AGE family epimerase/isomerase [Chitinophagaceae bacterium]
MAITETSLPSTLIRYKKEVESELHSILSWWMEHMPDKNNDGFYGSVSNINVHDPNAVKGLVLNSRILWTFSAAYSLTKNSLHLNFATEAFNYILRYFVDEELDGAYWSLNADGSVHDGRKQIYGIAFCIYGLAEYYKISKNKKALEVAVQFYEAIEKHSFDEIKNGYWEAFTRNWQPIDDLRLSDKDSNEAKTMNTHLHIVEAYTNLYSIWPDEKLKEQIINLLNLFDTCFINKKNHHYNLFFDNDWNLKSTLQSYGHDIEAAWLLQQCAEIIKDTNTTQNFRQLALPVTEATLEMIDKDGGMWYEYEEATDKMIYEKHSWPQAEAMIGFLNAYQVSGEERWLLQSLQSWNFIKQNIIDKENGEWFWGLTKDDNLMDKEKAGFWKCPYHSGRACLEVIYRIDKLLIQKKL